MYAHFFRNADSPLNQASGTSEAHSDDDSTDSFHHISIMTVQESDSMTPVNGNGLANGKNGKEVKKYSSQIELKRRIGLFNGCAIIIGVIIGSGIFISPKGVLESTGSPALSLGMWLFCGIYSMMGALCYAELGTMIPKSGGDYVYIHEAFGPLPAFIFLWMALVIVNPTSLAIIGLTFAKYTLKPFYVDEVVPDEVCRLVAATVILLLTAINCYKVRWSTRLQDVCMLAKVGAFGVIVIAAIIYVGKGNTQFLTYEKLTANTRYDPSSLAMAFYQGIFSFSGWNYLNFVTEELKEPNKNLPRAIYLSLPSVTIIYMLINLAYYTALSSESVLTSDAVAFSFAAETMGFFAFLVPIFVGFACLGTLNGIIFACSRMFYAGARNGQLPELLAHINLQNMTPMPSIIFLGGSSLVMLIINDIDMLVNYVSFAESAIVTMGVAGLLKMRLFDRSHPDRPIKINIIIPLTFFLICCYVLVAPFVQKPTELIVAAILIASGVPVYYIFVKWTKPACITEPWVKLTHFVQQVLLCVPDEVVKN
uniref:Y+L amino acid transporter 2 n=1 Tax=Panagrellus redivivus TaxID=6233 RepID=A0A7E4VPK1_PANRE